MNLAQQILNGLVLGSGYALIAIGWTVLLGAARLVNFAHGQLYMLGAFLAWLAIQKLGVSYFVAVPLAVLVLGLLGIVLQGMMLRLVMQQNLTSLMIVTLGFGYIIQGLAPRLFGADPQVLKSPLEAANLRFGTLWFTWQDVAIIVGTLLLFAVLWLVLNRTRTGALVRSVAEDPKLAQLFGINATLVYIGVFVFECAAVALGAGLVAPRSPILTSMGFDEVILTFVVVVLGGIGSIGGSLLAGLGLGMFTALFGALVSPAYTTAAAFLVLLAVLVMRPRGLGAR
ncbi:branched-chain amino acid ABC transporter permease [Enhydrobacter sp.]|jgi:branched-chain amino acid transport system permease protein|uniref:branched-chain amino acid ABC transporter permease n=1 Tax=Enhydrobacter sp. TaxID=1894999 RepID=UPI002604D24F|nr:branched-chain amino acid ABC transporter permease [Enhydrobacter sp.]WIM10120.1 MAG: high-affinity branched-chain amino acid transport system permease protein LivH [Enhydrobacter sp.]